MIYNASGVDGFVIGGSWPNVLGNNTDSSFAIDSEYAFSVPKTSGMNVDGQCQVVAQCSLWHLRMQENRAMGHCY